MLIIGTSWGNDSVALVQWLHEHSALSQFETATCVYANTGWASRDWPARVERGEALAKSYGFATVQLQTVGFVPLAQLKKAWPRNGMQFCTSELKIKPMEAFQASVDPAGESTIAIGIRREESAARSQWPEHVEHSEKHGGRSAWFPLVRVTSVERDALLSRAGFDPLPHRSRECYPCINSNRRDLRMIDEARVSEIEGLEQSMGETANGKPRTLFRPYRHGGAIGIREVVKWANESPGQYVPGQMLIGECDGGYCGD